ncbi:histone deacetylase [Fulvivirgaceae bacterium BMA10]|uniref:Histone deacetylase n=1 Tax=Splendidivirga corallicola TaxID=3051826 RepID=A0ABT8L0J3_9BACT|nr:histone deacetylase [Fulvivirgaceae bacterium BMA10]
MLKIAWSEVYAHPLPDNHRFPMIKYDLIPEQLLYEGTIADHNLFEPKPASEKLITTTHDIEYWNKLKTCSLSKSEQRRTGFPLSKQLVRREMVIMQGTIDAARHALKNRIAMNAAGGTHHAFTNKGEGFCLLNDMAMGARYLLNNKIRQKILIIDLDVHQGNGTAEIFKNESDVFTFSMHGDKNYPLHKEKSDLDIPLPDFTDDVTYLDLLEKNMAVLFERVQPDFVFYQSGVDVLETDKLGRIALSIDGCKKRDHLVLSSCLNNEVPIVVSMGGGYSEKITNIVEAHANTFRLAQELFF